MQKLLSRFRPLLNNGICHSGRSEASGILCRISSLESLERQPFASLRMACRQLMSNRFRYDEWRPVFARDQRVSAVVGIESPGVWVKRESWSQVIGNFLQFQRLFHLIHALGQMLLE